MPVRTHSASDDAVIGAGVCASTCARCAGVTLEVELSPQHAAYAPRTTAPAHRTKISPQRSSHGSLFGGVFWYGTLERWNGAHMRHAGAIVRPVRSHQHTLRTYSHKRPHQSPHHRTHHEHVLAPPYALTHRPTDSPFAPSPLSTHSS